MLERTTTPDAPDATAQAAPDPLAGLPPAPAHNPLWEDTPHRPSDPPLRRLPKNLGPNTPGGRAVRRLGRQVRAWREAHGVTQRELAGRLGMAQPNLARLEGGGVAPTLTTLALLAQRLGVRVTVAPGDDASEILVEDDRPAAAEPRSKVRSAENREGSAPPTPTDKVDR